MFEKDVSVSATFFNADGIGILYHDHILLYGHDRIYILIM